MSFSPTTKHNLKSSFPPYVRNHTLIILIPLCYRKIKMRISGLALLLCEEGANNEISSNIVNCHNCTLTKTLRKTRFERLIT